MSAAAPPLSVGADRVDITPDWPTPLAGFANPSAISAATVSAPPRLRTLAFAQGGERAVFVSADLLAWGADLVAAVRRDVAERHGVATESVLLHATHNHSGPQASRQFVPLVGRPDERYLGKLRRVTVEAVGRALDALTPVRVERAAASVSLVVDRRWARSGGALRSSPLDDDVTAVRFVAGDRTVAILAHYACHPVVHQDNAVSSDFTGAAMDWLEERRPGVVAVYAQGCCADVNPARYDGNQLWPGGQAEANQLGAELGEAIANALEEGGPALLPPAKLGSGEQTVELPVRSVPDVDELPKLAGEPGLRGQWASLLLAEPWRLAPAVEVRLSWLRLASGLALLGMSGEPVSAYGWQVKADSGGAVLPLGYTNGLAGYLVTARQLREGGYEADEAPYYFGMPAPFAPAAEPALRRALRAAVAAATTQE